MYPEYPKYTNKEDPNSIVAAFREQMFNILRNSDWHNLNLSYLSVEINRVFSDFLEHVKNRHWWGEKWEEGLFNWKMISNFIEYIKSRKKDRLFFYCFRKLIINSFESYVLGINNSIPKTPLNEYKNFTIWEKLFHNGYIWDLWQDKLCEWWDHSYWTVFFYDIFEELKQSWLDMDIKIFRFKKANTRMMEMDMGRYSWLIIKYKKKNYLIDSWRIYLLHEWLWKIAKSIDSFKTIMNNETFSRRVGEHDKFLLETLNNCKENEEINFFNNIDDFLNDISSHPEPPHISLYIDSNNNPCVLSFDKNAPHVKRESKISFDFTSTWIILTNGNYEVEYVLQNFEIDENDFINDFVKKSKVTGNSTIKWKDETYRIGYLKKYLEIIKDKISVNKLCEFYSNLQWKTFEKI